jgi:SAM-dependent methyltransferase
MEGATALLTEDEAQLNTTLKTRSEVDRYIDVAERVGFLRRHDPPKNWDNVKALSWIMKNHPNRDSVILDAGGLESGAFLPTLQEFGYRRLVALDLSNPEPPQIKGGIAYKRGDITSTLYPDNYFDAVGCLSVIEHGVPLERFFQEMARIMKPGGSLLVSTDYWSEKIVNPDGRRGFGVPVHIFSRQEMKQTVEIAAKHGFRVSGDGVVDYECQERTVNWMGFNYTFILVCFILNQAKQNRRRAFLESERERQASKSPKLEQVT